MIYTIEADNNITTYASAKEARAAISDDYEQFRSATELAKLAGSWPANRLTEVWNSLPGVKRIKKFTDRATGVSRVWQALQNQTPGIMASAAREVALQAAHVAEKQAEAGKQTPYRKRGPQMRPDSKTARILDLIQQPGGATLAALREATGWQPHSVRGFVSGTLGKKMGIKIKSAQREDGQRVYTLTK